MTDSKQKTVCIAKCEAIKAGYRQTSKGDFITFMVNEAPDNITENLVKLELGKIVNLYVTVEPED